MTPKQNSQFFMWRAVWIKYANTRLNVITSSKESLWGKLKEGKNNNLLLEGTITRLRSDLKEEKIWTKIFIWTTIIFIAINVAQYYY